jgi:hypothetical protein
VRSSDGALQPWQLFMLAGLLGASVVVLLAGRQTPAGVILLSLTIFTAAAVGVGAWRMLAPLTDRDEPMAPPIVGGRTRAALEREKTLVLRSIKDLEFDHAMGKVAEKDFVEMRTRLRARAAGLIRQLDAGSGYRERIENEVAKRIGAPAPGSSREPESAAAASASAACAACGTVNDVDARFCKHCGARMGSAA